VFISLIFLTKCTKSATDTEITISEQSTKFYGKGDIVWIRQCSAQVIDKTRTGRVIFFLDVAMFGLRRWYHSESDTSQRVLLRGCS